MGVQTCRRVVESYRETSKFVRRELGERVL